VIILKNHSTSLFAFLTFTLKSNYLLFTYLLVPLLVEKYENMAYLAPIFCFLITVVLFILLPKKMINIDYNKILDKSFISKLSYYLTQVISFFINASLVGYVIGKGFFSENNILIFIISSIALAVFISKSKLEVILNSSSFLLILAILLIIFPLFLTNDVKDYSFLLPIGNFKGFDFILLLYFILDSITMVYSNVKMKRRIKKWDIFIPVSIMLLFMSLELVNIIILTGTTYLKGNEFLGFFSLFIQDTINYVGNLGLFFLYVIPVVGCFKAGFALRRVKDFLKVKESLFNDIIMFSISLFLVMFCINFLQYQQVIYYLVIISIPLLLIPYILIIINRSPTYEIHF
jgi:hypothetical protein